MRATSRMLAALVALLGAGTGHAYGLEGHLIAGRAAAPALCERAAATITALAGDADLGETGLWADGIRSDPRYAGSAPWHYMNIDDDGDLSAYRSPPEGDVLWAIGYFGDRLADGRRSAAERLEALRFLVHFVVDIHQPLHVGRAADRGGNTIEFVWRGQRTNLHRFWDTHAIELAGLSVSAYVELLLAEISRGVSPVSLDPLDWAAESFALRAAVYDLDRRTAAVSPDYADFAAATTLTRLEQAARRLAGTLNALLC